DNFLKNIQLIMQMANPFQDVVEMPVDIKQGENWGACK
ncbi:hypothetical protein LCGC14_1243550, partial [marine sediment metagenome]